MEEIEIVEKRIKEQALENSKDFNLKKIGIEKAFEILNNKGLFVEVFDGVLGYVIKDKSQIKFNNLVYGVSQESDGKFYVVAKVSLTVSTMKNDYFMSFDLELTPFGAKLSRERGDVDCGKQDAKISEEWRKIVKFAFKSKYTKAFGEYCKESKKIARAKMEEELKRIEEYYDGAMNSI